MDPHRPAHDSDPDGERPAAEPMPDLALIRTDLANERTVLAYGRTALMLLGTGVSLVKFLRGGFELMLLGWFLIASGAVVGVIGVKRFTSLKRRLDPGRQER